MENKNFFATPKGNVTIVVGSLALVMIGIIGFGAHRGWFSSNHPSPKAPESDKNGGIDQVTTDGDKRPIVKSTSGELDESKKVDDEKVTDEEKWAIVKSPVSVQLKPDEIEETLGKIIPKEHKSLEDIKTVCSALPVMTKNQIFEVALDDSKSVSYWEVNGICFPSELSASLNEFERLLNEFLGSAAAAPEDQRAIFEEGVASNVRLFKLVSLLHEDYKSLFSVGDDYCDYIFAYSSNSFQNDEESRGKYETLKRFCPKQFHLSWEEVLRSWDELPD